MESLLWSKYNKVALKVAMGKKPFNSKIGLGNAYTTGTRPARYWVAHHRHSVYLSPYATTVLGIEERLLEAEVTDCMWLCEHSVSECSFTYYAQGRRCHIYNGTTDTPGFSIMPDASTPMFTYWRLVEGKNWQGLFKNGRSVSASEMIRTEFP